MKMPRAYNSTAKIINIISCHNHSKTYKNTDKQIAFTFLPSCTFPTTAYRECVVSQISMMSVFINPAEDWWHWWQIWPQRLSAPVDGIRFLSLIHKQNAPPTKPQYFRVRKILQPQKNDPYLTECASSAGAIWLLSYHRRWVAPKWNFQRATSTLI